MNERLKHVRKILGLTQDEFADQLGLVKSTISQWENGINPIPAATVVAVCAVFGVSRKYLEQGTGEIFDKPDKDPLTALSSQYRLSKADCQVIEAYCKMQPKQRQAVRDFMASASGRASMDDAAYSKT